MVIFILHCIHDHLRTHFVVSNNIQISPIRSNIKNTWGVINEIISKSVKTKSFPDIFKDGQHELNDGREIANRFNAFFTNVGPDQSRNIRYNGNKTHQTYLTHNYDIELNFTEVNDDIILNIINKLPNKNSRGFDNLSTKIIKALKDSLIKPLTLIINQIFYTGVFPSKLNIAKVIPIFQKMTTTCLITIYQFRYCLSYLKLLKSYKFTGK